MDALADADTRAVREAKQAKWGAIWAGAVTIGAIAWVLSGLPQTRAPELPETGQAPSSPTVSTAPIAPVKPVTLKEPIALKEPVMATPAANAEVAAPPKPAMLARDMPARRAPPRIAQTARTRAPAPRISEDTRIRNQVAERLTSNRNISGRIGIDSRGSVVYLTGYTMTMEQARRAEREARSVRGVRAVRNEIRARVGGAY